MYTSYTALLLTTGRQPGALNRASVGRLQPGSSIEMFNQGNRFWWSTGKRAGISGRHQQPQPGRAMATPEGGPLEDNDLNKQPPYRATGQRYN